MDDMIQRLDNLRIRGFRGFKDLSIDNIGSVNLFVGKNNSGKTSILEAVQLYYSGADRIQLINLLVKREEYRLGARSTEPFLALESFFYGRPDLEDSFRYEGGASFTIGPTEADDFSTLSVRFELLERRTDDLEGAVRYVPASRRAGLFEDLGDAQIVPGITAGFRHRDIVIPLSRFDDRMVRSRPTTDARSPVVYLSSVGMVVDEINSAWDAIALTPDEDRVVEFLRIIIPTLEKIAVVQSPREARARILLAKLRQFEKPVPLKSLGEGANHLLGIILGLVRARNGILIVDEIENGIHYSVQSELWRIIFFAAKSWNVQIFATTHSWDCVKGFSSQSDASNGGILYRVETDGEYASAVQFSPDEIDIAVDRQIEVR